MLVYERRAGEALQLGDEIEVRVLDTDGQTVRIGVEAPRDVRIEAVDAATPEDDSETGTNQK
ncbi:carbon storage regulator [Salinisphaera dokdonensis CL-ES53]|uniref:Carbon storage regulator n=1 Tax=Salinisphaera dokdonensis CL-ES53 TaxID=1304272 RepID=A0ABV2B2F4_9GAMM